MNTGRAIDGVTPPFISSSTSTGYCMPTMPTSRAIFGHADRGTSLEAHPEVQVIVSASWHTASHTREGFCECCGPSVRGWFGARRRLLSIACWIQAHQARSPEWLTTKAAATGDAQDPLNEALAREN